MGESIATLIGNALALLAAMAKRLGAQRYLPRTHPAAHAPRGMQRRSARGTRSVERAVIDQWLMWRK